MTVKNFSQLRFCCGVFMALFMLVLVACSAQPAASDMIKPGDTVNGVLITTGDDTATFPFDLDCKQEENTWTCPAVCGEDINPLTVVYNPNEEERNKAWETFEYTVEIEGRPVDLEAFGTIDFVHDQTGMYMRAYNLVLKCDEPTTITVVDKGALGGEEASDTTIIFNFEEP